MPRHREKKKAIIRFSSHPSRLSLVSITRQMPRPRKKTKQLKVEQSSSFTLKLGFHYTANATTMTQKQSNYKVEQSSFTFKPGFHCTANATTTTKNKAITRLSGLPSRLSLVSITCQMQ